MVTGWVANEGRRMNSQTMHTRSKNGRVKGVVTGGQRRRERGLRSGRNRGGQARGLAAVDAGVQDIQVK